MQLAFDPKIVPFPIQKQPPRIVAISPSGLFTDYDNDTLTSDGRTKAQKADPLRSFEDYARIHAYFSSKGQIRNASLLTIGIATGLRISDLISLKYGHFYTSDKNGNPIFRHHITIHEKKTNKKTYSLDDSVLITPAVQQAVDALQAYTSKKEKRILSLDDWLFPSKQPRQNKYITDDDGNEIEDPLYGEKVITPEYGHRIMKDAQKALDLPLNIGSHTLRKTFACLALVIARQSASDSAAALETVQTLLRHDSVKTTLRYLGITNESTERIRLSISDFLLGNSDIENISLL